jgi:hypothetical protein
VVHRGHAAASALPWRAPPWLSPPRSAARPPSSLSTTTARASMSSGAARFGAVFSGRASSGGLYVFSTRPHPIEASATASSDADESEHGNPAKEGRLAQQWRRCGGRACCCWPEASSSGIQEGVYEQERLTIF